MENLPFAHCSLPEDYIYRNNIAKVYYNDDATEINIWFHLSFKIYKYSIIILFMEEGYEIPNTYKNGEYLEDLKKINYKQKDKIDLINFDIFNFYKLITDIGDYIINYTFNCKRSGSFPQSQRLNWIDNSKNLPLDTILWPKEQSNMDCNSIHIFMNKFLDFFILYTNLKNTNLKNNNFKKLSKCIIIEIFSFLIEEEFIKLFEF